MARNIALIYRDRTYGLPTMTTDEQALKSELEAKGFTVTAFYSGQVSGGNWGSGDGYKVRSAANFSSYEFIVACWDSEYIDWCSYCASPCSCPSHCSRPSRICVVCSP